MKQTLTLFALLASSIIFAQSPKNVVVEHFTNTRCSICASRNPAFYQTLDNYPQVIHIAIHPSSPYSNCYFNQQNVAENDARTQYYGIYGSTPRLVIQGKPIPSANPSITNTTIDTLLNQTSPIEISATEQLIGTDSVSVRIVVRKTGSFPLTSFKLFAAVTEEPINYNAGNGETVHHNVFRKALTDATGNTFSVSDSMVFVFTYQVQAGWELNNLSTVAIVQRSGDKEVFNAARSTRIVTVPTGIADLESTLISVYPNPANERIMVSGYKLDNSEPARIINTKGSVVLEQPLSNGTTQFDISSLPKGVYVLRIGNSNARFVKQ